jgi:hypothetical protein
VQRRRERPHPIRGRYVDAEARLRGPSPVSLQGPVTIWSESSH